MRAWCLIGAVLSALRIAAPQPCLSAPVSPAAAPAAAAPTATTKADVVFDHSGRESKFFTLDLRNGQKFTVKITNTCPSAFDYSFAGVESAATPSAKVREAETPQRQTKDLEVVHDNRFRGYIFSVNRKVKPVECADPENKTLAPVSFIVAVRENDWNLSFSGGFTISSLTSPVFAIQTDTNGKKTIVTEPDKEDERKLGVASFVHVGHDALAWKGIQPVIAFGLGITSDNRAEYLLGLGLRLGDKATVNFGGAWGTIARLPNGMTLNTEVSGDNVLNNLGSQVVRRWFFGITYSFIDTKDRLLKPFAEGASKSPS